MSTFLSWPLETANLFVASIASPLTLPKGVAIVRPRATWRPLTLASTMVLSPLALTRRLPSAVKRTAVTEEEWWSRERSGLQELPPPLQSKM